MFYAMLQEETYRAWGPTDEEEAKHNWELI